MSDEWTEARGTGGEELLAILVTARCCRDWPVSPLGRMGHCGYCGEIPKIVEDE